MHPMKRKLYRMQIFLVFLFLLKPLYSAQDNQSHYFINSKFEIDILPSVRNELTIESLVDTINTVSYYFSDDFFLPFVKVQVGRGLIFTTYNVPENLIYLGLPSRDAKLNYATSDLLNLLIHEFGHAIFEHELNQRDIDTQRLSLSSEKQEFLLRAYHEFFADFLVVLMNQNPEAMASTVKVFEMDYKGRSFTKSEFQSKNLGSFYENFNRSKSTLGLYVQKPGLSPLVLKQVTQILIHSLQEDLLQISQSNMDNIQQLLDLTDVRVDIMLKNQLAL